MVLSKLNETKDAFRTPLRRLWAGYEKEVGMTQHKRGRVYFSSIISPSSASACDRFSFFLPLRVRFGSSLLPPSRRGGPFFVPSMGACSRHCCGVNRTSSRYSQPFRQYCTSENARVGGVVILGLRVGDDADHLFQVQVRHLKSEREQNFETHLYR